MRMVAVVSLSALIGTSCAPQPPHSCSGAALDVLINGLPDAGLDAGYTGADGGRQPKPPCAGDCRDYRAALVEGLNANVPAAACLSLLNRVQCLPSSESNGCPGNTLESARALEPAIANYLSAEWPELGPDGGQRSIDTCPCRIY